MNNPQYEGPIDNLTGGDATPAPTPPTRTGPQFQVLPRRIGTNRFNLNRVVGPYSRKRDVRNAAKEYAANTDSDRDIERQADEFAMVSGATVMAGGGSVNQTAQEWNSALPQLLSSLAPAGPKDYAEERERLLDMAFPDMPERERATLKTIDKTQGSAGIGYALANLLTGSGGEALRGLAAPVEATQARLDQEYETRLINLQQAAEQAKYMLGVIDGKEAFDRQKYLQAQQLWTQVAMQGQELSLNQLQFGVRTKLDTMMANSVINAREHGLVMDALSLPHIQRGEYLKRLSEDGSMPEELRNLARGLAVVPPTPGDKMLDLQVDQARIATYIQEQTKEWQVELMQEELRAAKARGDISEAEAENVEDLLAAQLDAIRASTWATREGVALDRRRQDLAERAQANRERQQEIENEILIAGMQGQGATKGVIQRVVTSEAAQGILSEMLDKGGKFDYEGLRELVNSSELGPTDIEELGNAVSAVEGSWTKRKAFVDAVRLRLQAVTGRNSAEESRTNEETGGILSDSSPDVTVQPVQRDNLTTGDLFAVFDQVRGEFGDSAEMINISDAVMMDLLIDGKPMRDAGEKKVKWSHVDNMLSTAGRGYSILASKAKAVNAILSDRAEVAGVKVEDGVYSYTPPEGATFVGGPGGAPAGDPFSVTNGRFSISPDWLKKFHADWDDTGYRYGAKGSKKAIDCSGFVCATLNEMGYAQGGASSDGLRGQRAAIPAQTAQIGDLVFWHNKTPTKARPNGVGHVAYFLGWNGDKMVVLDSSGGRGVSRREVAYNADLHSFGKPWKSE